MGKEGDGRGCCVARSRRRVSSFPSKKSSTMFPRSAMICGSGGRCEVSHRERVSAVNPKICAASCAFQPICLRRNRKASPWQIPCSINHKATFFSKSWISFAQKTSSPCLVFFERQALCECVSCDGECVFLFKCKRHRVTSNGQTSLASKVLFKRL